MTELDLDDLSDIAGRFVQAKRAEGELTYRAMYRDLSERGVPPETIIEFGRMGEAVAALKGMDYEQMIEYIFLTCFHMGMLAQEHLSNNIGEPPIEI